MRFAFKTGFSQTLRKQRLAGLVEIDELLKTNAQNLRIDSDNLSKLANAARELDEFYFTSGDRSLELLATQLMNSTRVLIARIKEGKLHKASVKALAKAVGDLQPQVSDIIKAELEKDVPQTHKVRFVNLKSS